MTGDGEWGVFEHARWDGGIVFTGRGYVVRRLDDPRPPYCHMKPVATYARERAAEHNAQQRGTARTDDATNAPSTNGG